MLPVVAGDAATRRQILLYSLILAPLGAAAVAASALPALGLRRDRGVSAALAVRCSRWRVYAADDGVGDASAPHASCSAFSILYLFLLFAALLVERCRDHGGSA